MPAYVYWVDKNYRMLGCKKNVLKFLGMTSLDEFVGKSYEELSEIANWQEGLAESFKHDDSLVIEQHQVIRSKNEPPVKSSNVELVYYVSDRVPIINENNEITGFMGISFDVIELRTAYEKLKNTMMEMKAANDHR